VSAGEEGAERTYEELLRTAKAGELITQFTATLLNLAVHRLGAAGGGQQSLAEAKPAIDGARALLGVLEGVGPQVAVERLRAVLTQVQLAYTQAVGSAGRAPQRGDGDGRSDPDRGGAERRPHGASGLWIPGER